VRFSICDLDKRGDRDRRSVSLCDGRDSGPAQTATCKKMSWSPKTGSGGWGSSPLTHPYGNFWIGPRLPSLSPALGINIFLQKLLLISINDNNTRESA
jgi:hypothetical protein